MFGLLDVIILLFLALGAIIGFKRGVIKSATMFLGTILVLILSFYIKNPVSKIMYTYLPFINLGGVFEGLEVFNILIYEAIAFLLVYVVLMIVLKIIIKITGVIEAILKFTIILGIPSKILGAIFGLFEEYIFVFLALFLLTRVSFMAPLISESKLAEPILTSSPGISNLTNDYYSSFKEIYSLKEKYENMTDKTEYNKEALKVLLDKQIITPDAAKDLVEKGKLKTDGLKDVINDYEKEGENND